MSEQHLGAHLAAEPDGAPLDTADQHRREPLAVPSPAEPHHPRPPALHAGPGVEPGSDDELDAVSSGPSPTHPHEPTDVRTPAHEPAPEPTDIRTPADEPAPEPDRHPHTGRRARARADRHPYPAHEPAHPVPAPPPAASGHPVAPASPHPERWGRVDADGTVYVHTADGERAVGSWQAGEPAEGLAHYARRFDDVLTEAELLVSRLPRAGRPQAHAVQRTHAARRPRRGARRRRRRRARARCSTAW